MHFCFKASVADFRSPFANDKENERPFDFSIEELFTEAAYRVVLGFLSFGLFNVFKVLPESMDYGRFIFGV